MKLFELKLIVLLFCSYFPALCAAKDFLIEYPTYPTPSFTKVEKICRDLLIDLEAVAFNPQLHLEWVEKSDYLFNQFLILVHAINNLVANHEECRSYLLEDIHYLNNVLCLVEQAFIKVYPEPTPACSLMYTSLQQCTTQLASITHLNQEIISS